MSSTGSHEIDWAIIARWRWPPESWWGYLLNAVGGSGISTLVSSSSARSLACSGFMSKCARSASMIWNPTVYTGLSAVIGSWKITAISLPRTSRSSRSGMPRSSRPSSLIEPLTFAFAGSSPSSAIELELLPEPDSPTIASTSPRRTS